LIVGDEMTTLLTSASINEDSSPRLLQKVDAISR
jgi:hypothetical protein